MYLRSCIYIYMTWYTNAFSVHTQIGFNPNISKKKKSHIKIRFVNIFVMRTQIFLVLNMCNKNSQIYKLSVIINTHQIRIWKLLHWYMNCQTRIQHHRNYLKSFLFDSPAQNLHSTLTFSANTGSSRFPCCEAEKVVAHLSLTKEIRGCISTQLQVAFLLLTYTRSFSNLKVEREIQPTINLHVSKLCYLCLPQNSSYQQMRVYLFI